MDARDVTLCDMAKQRAEHVLERLLQSAEELLDRVIDEAVT